MIVITIKAINFKNIVQAKYVNEENRFIIGPK